jgi:ribosomal peptide maturation radical SAM protein 1
MENSFDTLHMKSTRDGFDKVALVSAPWPRYNYPSIQLGTLKAFLTARFPDLSVHAHHFYLNVAKAMGYPVYQTVSERLWLAESVFAALLFPERRDSIARMFQREAQRRGKPGRLDFEVILENVGEATESFLGAPDWTAYGLIGFSVCLSQLTSTLFIVDRIKTAHPNLLIVLGGSGLAGNPGKSFFRAFPKVDLLVVGEGEQPLVEIIHRLRDGDSPMALADIPGVITQATEGLLVAPAFSQLSSLNDLPCPDFGDYFELLRSLGAEHAFFPVLPVEMSRGCWWRQRSGSRDRKGCTFCNLNLQWEGYRSKSPARAVSEIESLTGKHQVLALAFTDNVLPLPEGLDAFVELAKSERDFHLFAELRSTTPLSVLTQLRKAGLNEVQIGIEALSSRLLKKMNKGSSAIQNLEVMRHCEELGLVNTSNLMLEFPGSDQRDVDETLHALDFALPFLPLRPVSFWLGLGSPACEEPKRFGLKEIRNHPNYGVLFPESICDSLTFMVQDFRGAKGNQKYLWHPVRRKLRAWQGSYRQIHAALGPAPLLHYRDGGDFLIIHQRKGAKEILTHRLTGLSREVYLFCRSHRSLARILGRFHNLPEDRLSAFLRMMVEKRLMFEESGCYLSLAARIRQ